MTHFWTTMSLVHVWPLGTASVGNLIQHHIHNQFLFHPPELECELSLPQTATVTIYKTLMPRLLTALPRSSRELDERSSPSATGASMRTILRAGWPSAGILILRGVPNGSPPSAGALSSRQEGLQLRTPESGTVDSQQAGRIQGLPCPERSLAIRSL